MIYTPYTCQNLRGRIFNVAERWLRSIAMIGGEGRGSQLQRPDDV